MPLYLWEATFGEKIVSEVFIKKYYELFVNGYCARVKTGPKLLLFISGVCENIITRLYFTHIYFLIY